MVYEQDDKGNTFVSDGLYKGVEFSCSDAYEQPIEVELKAEQTAEWLEKLPTMECAAMQLITRRVQPGESSIGGDFGVPLQFSQETMKLAAWPMQDYHTLWQSAVGGSATQTDSPARFMVQTPQDEGPFCSFSLKSKGWYVKGVYLYNDDRYEPRKVMTDSLMQSGWRNGAHQIIGLPIAFLKVHVADTSQELAKLGRQVAVVEHVVSQPRNMYDNSVDFGDLSLRLHSCATRLVQLERRVAFERSLVLSIESYIASMTRNPGFGELNRGRLELQKSMMRTAQQELESLPKRIENQRTMIFNLIVQRDQRLNISINRANMEIAENARQIAEATMADSAAMKSIAILTMVFLPGTAVASFFSMTMFNWNAGPGQSLASTYIWIYFVAAVPLTMLVLGTWFLYDRRTRQRIRRSNTLTSFDNEMVEQMALKADEKAIGAKEVKGE